MGKFTLSQLSDGNNEELGESDTEAQEPTSADLLWSASAAEENPVHDGKPTTGHCKTQTTVSIHTKNGEVKPHREELSCTSCHDDRALVMYFHKAGTGACRKYPLQPTSRCCPIDADYHTAGPDNNNQLCTKIVKVLQRFSVDHIEDATTKAALQKFAGQNKDGKGWGVAECDVAKHVACRGNNCKAQKFVKCRKICRATGWSPSHGQYDQCDASACQLGNGAYGRLACKQAAITV